MSSIDSDWLTLRTYRQTSNFKLYKTSLEMLHRSHPRMYAGRPARTRLVSTTVRVPVDTRPLPVIDKPLGSRAHQGGTNIFRFQPDPNHKCCKRKCMSHFPQEHDQRVVDARAPLHDPCLSPDDRRFRHRQNWKIHLRVVSDG